MSLIPIILVQYSVKATFLCHLTYIKNPNVPFCLSSVGHFPFSSIVPCFISTVTLIFWGHGTFVPSYMYLENFNAKFLSFGYVLDFDL